MKYYEGQCYCKDQTLTSKKAKKRRKHGRFASLFSTSDSFSPEPALYTGAFSEFRQ